MSLKLGLLHRSQASSVLLHADSLLLQLGSFNTFLAIMGSIAQLHSLCMNNFHEALECLKEKLSQKQSSVI